MQITADISKIWKTVQCGIIFIFDVLLGSAIGFELFLVSLLVNKVLLVLHKITNKALLKLTKCCFM